MSRKIGFWAVFALVIGSQIGSGVLMLPAGLAAYGGYSIAGWLISSVGAIALALVFALLCSRLPHTGGPHVYVKAAFGNTAAFFTGWTYWVISWVSTTAVIVACVGYLTPFIGDHSRTVYLGVELLLLLMITLLNLKGVKTAGNAEFFLTLLKFIPLVLLPLIALYYFDTAHFVIDTSKANLDTSQILGHVTLLTLWGFVGLETATTPAGSIENPSKTIPRAIVFGTICVAVLYIINSIAIMGLIPGQELMHSKAPYVDAAQRLFGSQWHLLISVIAAIVCIGTLNAWILTSGQIALGLAEDKLMPGFFAQRNKTDAPIWGLMISSIGIVPLLILTANESLAQQIIAIIDFSVVAFLFVYLICCFGFLKLLIQQDSKVNWPYCLCAFVAIVFCGWIIYETSLKTVAIASLFVVSGLPVYFFWFRQHVPISAPVPVSTRGEA